MELGKQVVPKGQLAAPMPNRTAETSREMKRKYWQIPEDSLNLEIPNPMDKRGGHIQRFFRHNHSKMKISNPLLPIICLAVVLSSCNQNETNRKDVQKEPSPKAVVSEQSLYGKGSQGPSEFFTGASYVQRILPRDSVPNNYSIGEVVFEPGSRSNWHDHPAGQVLLVTSGHGFAQERGKSARAIKKGDVVICQPDVEHWHGAAPDSEMSHIAITHYKGDEGVNWKEPVTEAEYTKAVQ